MKRALLVTLSVGIGWVLGIVVMMAAMPFGGNFNYSLLEALGNTIVFGFPGFVLLMVSIILSLRDDVEQEFYRGTF